MNIIENICANLSNKIRHYIKDIDDEKYEVINYGMYLLIGDFLKTIITLSISYFLGILTYVVISIISMVKELEPVLLHTIFKTPEVVTEFGVVVQLDMLSTTMEDLI